MMGRRGKKGSLSISSRVLFFLAEQNLTLLIIMIHGILLQGIFDLRGRKNKEDLREEERWSGK